MNLKKNFTIVVLFFIASFGFAQLSIEEGCRFYQKLDSLNNFTVRLSHKAIFVEGIDVDRPVEIDELGFYDQYSGTKLLFAELEKMGAIEDLKFMGYLAIQHYVAKSYQLEDGTRCTNFGVKFSTVSGNELHLILYDFEDLKPKSENIIDLSILIKEGCN